jgi:hypothetical protein
MNKLLLAFFMSLGIIMPQIYSISLTQYIQQHGMPQVRNVILDLSKKHLTSLEGLEDISNSDQVQWLDLSDNQ